MTTSGVARQPAGDLESASPHAPDSSAPLATARSVVAALAGVVLASYFLYGFSTLAPMLVAPLVAGAIGAYLSPRDFRWASILTAAGQTVGFWAAASTFTVHHTQAALQSAPVYVRADMATDVYSATVRSILLANTAAPDMQVVMWLIGVILATAVAGYLRYSGLVERDARWGVLPFAAATMLVALSFVVTLYGSSDSFRRDVASEPQSGQYATDEAIYEKVPWLLARGVPYYQALPQAAAGDVRLQSEGSVRDGRFVRWATSPSMVRQPYSFLFVKWFAPGGPPGVFDLSAVCSLLVLVGLAWSLGLRSRGAGLTAEVALFPFLIMGGGWLNIMLPDWWACLAVMGSAAALLARHPAFRYLAIALALAAALFRESAVLWLLGVVLLTAWEWFRTRRRREMGAVLAASASVGLFAIAYAAHLAAARGIIEVAKVEPLFEVLKRQAGGSIEARFLAPTSYLLFPYGQFAVPGFVLIALGCASFLAWGALKRDGAAVVCGGYVSAWLIYLLVVGTFSAYWGLLFSGLGLVGLGFATAFGDAGAGWSGAE